MAAESPGCIRLAQGAARWCRAAPLMRQLSRFLLDAAGDLLRVKEFSDDIFADIEKTSACAILEACR